MLNHKRTAAIVAALALTAVGPAPSALAQTQDLRAPDAIDAYQGRYLGSPATSQDLSSPDARDANEHYAPTMTESPIAQPTRFDWESPTIAAAAGTALMVIALGLAVSGRRRRTLARQA